MVIAIAVAGIALAGLLEGLASKQVHARGDGNLRALEAAETGIARAEEEISSKIDTAADGLGNLTGSFAGCTYQVTATNSPSGSSRWILRGVGRSGLSRRSI